jgi:hypothetical protein
MSAASDSISPEVIIKLFLIVHSRPPFTQGRLSLKHFVFAFGLMMIPLSSMYASIDMEWARHSSPTIRSKTFEYNFEKLPLTGMVAERGHFWSGDYWASRKGHINFRWNATAATDQVGFRLRSPTREQAASMTIDQLSQLAPSEKLDLLNGDYEYSLVKEVASMSSRGAPEWYGICHGWSPATINHKEPTPKILMSNDGIRVPFGSSDIKALLSWYYANHHSVDSTHQMGKRCFSFGLNPGCSRNDLNAGAFHVVLANTIGITGEGFVADIEKSELVWNYPVHHYKTEIVKVYKPADDSAPGTVKRIRVKTEMGYVKENKVNSWYPLAAANGNVIGVAKYDYMLDIDSAGKIVGGEWVTKTRPDFIWSMDRATEFQGMFSRMAELTND